MSKPQVIVEASPDGTITVETVGVKGPACEKLSAAIEAAIGTVTENARKAEYNQREIGQPLQVHENA